MVGEGEEFNIMFCFSNQTGDLPGSFCFAQTSFSMID